MLIPSLLEMIAMAPTHEQALGVALVCKGMGALGRQWR